MSDDGTERDHEGEMERDKERERRPCRDSYIILMKGSAALDQAEAGPNGNQGIAKYNLKKTLQHKSAHFTNFFQPFLTFSIIPLPWSFLQENQQ